MGELEINDLIFSTMGGDLPSLLWVVLGVPKTTATRWCDFGKLNLRLVFDYFSGSGLPKGERPWLYNPRTFGPFAYVPLQGISLFNSHIM